MKDQAGVVRLCWSGRRRHRVFLKRLIESAHFQNSLAITVNAASAVNVAMFDHTSPSV